MNKRLHLIKFKKAKIIVRKKQNHLQELEIILKKRISNRNLLSSNNNNKII